MKKSTRTKIDRRLDEVFLTLNENALIENGKLRNEAQQMITEVTNELLNEITRAEARELDSEASFSYGEKGEDLFNQETVIDYIAYKLVNFIQGVSRADEKVFRGVVDSDSEFATYAYKQANKVYYDENEPSTVDSQNPYVTSQADLYKIFNEYNKIDFEEEFNRLDKKTNHSIDWHNFLKKCLFTDMFFESSKDCQDKLLSVFVKQVNMTKLTDSQREIIARFLHNKKSYSELSANEKKQVHRITNKMNLK